MGVRPPSRKRHVASPTRPFYPSAVGLEKQSGHPSIEAKKPTRQGALRSSSQLASSAGSTCPCGEHTSLAVSQVCSIDYECNNLRAKQSETVQRPATEQISSHRARPVGTDDLGPFPLGACVEDVPSVLLRRALTPTMVYVRRVIETKDRNYFRCLRATRAPCGGGNRAYQLPQWFCCLSPRSRSECSRTEAEYAP